MASNNIISNNVANIYALSPMQEGILYHNLVDVESTGYVIQHRMKLTGEIDKDRYEQAMELVVARYDVLRTSFVSEKVKKPWQIVLKSRYSDFEYFDLSNEDIEIQKQKLENIASLDVKRGFDLQKDILFRSKLIRLGNESAEIIWCYHHIIMDGWCVGILFETFLRYYRMLQNTSVQNVKALIAQERANSTEYGEYIKWITSRNQDEAFTYWKDLLEDYDEVAEIKPISKPELTECQVKKEEICLSKEKTAVLSEIAAKNEVTLSTIAECAWGILLQKYNCSDDVVFGKIVSGRDADVRGIERMLGLCINAIPVRIKSTDNMSIKELWKNQQDQNSDSSDKSYCSLAEIQSLTKQKQNLIKTLFVYENYFGSESSLDDFSDNFKITVEASREQTNYGISAMAKIEEGIFKFGILYNPSEFCAEEIRTILKRIEKIMDAFVTDVNRKVSDIDVVTEYEKDLIFHKFNDTDIPYPNDKTFIDFFEKQVEKNPEGIAIVSEKNKLSYLELNGKANTLSKMLIGKGTKKNSLVAIMASRDSEIIISIIAVLKTGAAYIPIDPEYPEERIKYIIDDCKADYLITYHTDIETTITKIELPSMEDWPLDEINPDVPIDVHDLAYCIYTSGTTGKPKGVMIEHQGIANLREYFIRMQSVTESDRVLQFSSLSFDASISELTMTLLIGASLYIPSQYTRMDTLQLEKYIADNRISIAILPPMFLSQLHPVGLRTIIAAGSETNKKLVENNKNIPIYSNDYGPTEGTVCATFWKHNCDDPVPDRIPIGRPMNNKKVFILNKLTLCGIGMPGEICISGVGIARGYLNQEELTEQKFISNPYGSGKLYRTGDLGRWREDGNIEYLGRLDNQVKIRAFRIELGEVENSIKEIKGITDAVVIARDDVISEKVIVGYYVTDQDLEEAEVKKSLKKTLPDYMIPSFMVRLEKLPVNKNGKVSKADLPLPDINSIRNNNEIVLAQTEEQQHIAGAWMEVLKLPQISINDNFFDLGGNSLSLILLKLKLDTLYPDMYSYGDLFANPTIAKMAEFVEIKKRGVQRLREIVFPKDFFTDAGQSNMNSELVYRNSTDLYNAIYKARERYSEEFEAQLILIFVYLLYLITNQSKLQLCIGSKNKYSQIEVEVDAQTDLNELVRTIADKYKNALRVEKAKFQVEKKENGLVPIFLYDFDGDDVYKSFSDFSLDVKVENNELIIKAKKYRYSLSNSKIRDVLKEFVRLLISMLVTK